MTAATSGFSKDSWAMTWHQWQVEYPIERKIGLFSSRAFANASSPHGSHSTGLSACWRRYGDFSAASLLPIIHPIDLPSKAKEGRFTNRPFQDFGPAAAG